MFLDCFQALRNGFDQPFLGPAACSKLHGCSASGLRDEIFGAEGLVPLYTLFGLAKGLSQSPHRTWTFVGEMLHTSLMPIGMLDDQGPHTDF